MSADVRGHTSHLVNSKLQKFDLLQTFRELFFLFEQAEYFWGSRSGCLASHGGSSVVDYFLNANISSDL